MAVYRIAADTVTRWRKAFNNAPTLFRPPPTVATDALPNNKTRKVGNAQLPSGDTTSKR